MVKKVSKKPIKIDGMSSYLQKIFGIMFGAVALTALTTFFVLYSNGISLIFNEKGLSSFFYIMLFGGLGISLFTQYRIFSLKSSTAVLLIALYSISIGFTIAPIVMFALQVNPISILQAFVISSLMFGCMALFGYKTVKDLSFLGTFLFIGMIGLVLVGIVSMFWPLGSTFSTIVSLIGVLIFALFTAYDMQFLKNAYNEVANTKNENKLAILGALHMYISFVAMFQHILNLLNRR